MNIFIMVLGIVFLQTNPKDQILSSHSKHYYIFLILFIVTPFSKLENPHLFKNH